MKGIKKLDVIFGNRWRHLGDDLLGAIAHTRTYVHSHTCVCAYICMMMYIDVCGACGANKTLQGKRADAINFSWAIEGVASFLRYTLRRLSTSLHCISGKQIFTNAETSCDKRARCTLKPCFRLILTKKYRNWLDQFRRPDITCWDLNLFCAGTYVNTFLIDMSQILVLLPFSTNLLGTSFNHFSVLKVIDFEEI